MCNSYGRLILFNLHKLKTMKYNLKEKKLILEALKAYKDDDNEEYNIEINELINKIIGDI